MKMIIISRTYLWLTGCFGLKQEDDDHDKIEWSKKLPNDITRLILQRLPLSDYLQCRDVCPNWRALIDSKRCPPAPHQLVPWLLLDSEHLFFVKDGCLVMDHRKISKSNPAVRHRPRCVGSIEGWLILHEHIVSNSYFFLNPISGARVRLPSSKYMELEKVVASSVPTRLQQCYVARLNLLSGGLDFCTPTNKSWTPIEAIELETEKTLEFRDIEIIDGKLYAATHHALEFLMVFDIQLDANDGLPTYTAERLVMQHPSGGRILDHRFYFRTWYLVKDFESQQLFIVLRNATQAHVTEGFQVLKLEHCNVGGGARWVEVVDLGDRILFVSMLNNKFISCAGGVGDETLERNCIYFAFDWCSETSCIVVDFGVFSMTNRSIKPLIFPMNRLTREFNQKVWFTPNPW